MSTLADAVYQALWPDGKIPLKVARNLPAIDGRIKEIQRLAEGKLPLGMDRRILDPAMSADITEQIIKLREGSNPPMRWRDIARQIGHNQTSDSVRARYIAAQERAMKKEGYEALSGEAMTEQQIMKEILTTEPASQEFRPHEHDEPSGDSGQFEHIGDSEQLAPGPVRTSPEAEKLPTNLPENCQLADTKEILSRAAPDGKEADAALRSAAGAAKQPFGSYHANFEEAPVQPKEPEPGRNKYGRYNADVPPEVDEIIESMWKGGHDMKEISAALAKKGYEMDYLRVRGRISSVIAKKNKHNERQEDKSAKATENVPPRQPAPENVAPVRSEPMQDNKPAPKFISRKDLDLKIWDLWKKQGKTPAEISDQLCDEGLYYGEKTVRTRLLQQGATL